MAKYLIINANQVSYASLKDSDLTKLVLANSDTGLITVPIGISTKQINTFIEDNTEFIRKSVREFKTPDLVRVFLSINKVAEGLELHLTSIGNETINHVIPVIDIKQQDAQAKLFTSVGEVLGDLSSKYKIVEFYVEGNQPFTTAMVQLINLGKFPNNNITLFVVSSKHLPLLIIKNLKTVTPTFEYVTPASFNEKSPTVSHNKQEYLDYIKQSNKALRDVIFNKFNELKPTLEQQETPVATFDESVNNEPTQVAETIEAVELETQPLEVVDTPSETDQVDTVPQEVHEQQVDETSIVGTHNELTELRQQLELKNDEIKSLNEIITENTNSIKASGELIEELHTAIEENRKIAKDYEIQLEKANQVSQDLETKILSIEETFTAQLAEKDAVITELNLELEKHSIASQKVNDFEIERLTEDLVRLKQVEENYLDLSVKYKNNETEYRNISELYHKLNNEFIEECGKTTALTEQLAEVKEKLLKAESHLTHDSNLNTLLEKIQVMEHTLNHVDDNVLAIKAHQTELLQSDLQTGLTQADIQELKTMEEVDDEIEQLSVTHAQTFNMELPITEDTYPRESTCEEVDESYSELDNKPIDFSAQKENIIIENPFESVEVEEEATNFSNPHENFVEEPVVEHTLPEEIELPESVEEMDITKFVDDYHNDVANQLEVETHTTEVELEPLPDIPSFQEVAIEDDTEIIPDNVVLPTSSTIDTGEIEEIQEEIPQLDELDDLPTTELDPLDELEELDELEDLDDEDDDELPPLELPDIDDEDDIFNTPSQADTGLEDFFNGTKSSLSDYFASTMSK